MSMLADSRSPSSAWTNIMVRTRSYATAAGRHASRPWGARAQREPQYLGWLALGVR